jgi:hypothetical protein
VIAPHQHVLVIVPDYPDHHRACGPKTPVKIDHGTHTIDVTGLGLSIEAAEPFDYIVLGDALACCPDIGSFLHRLRQLCAPHTRVIASSRQGGLAALARRLRAARSDRVDQSRNLLGVGEMRSIMTACGFEPTGWRGLSRRAGNRGLAIYRPIPAAAGDDGDSLTVCLTCRNEKGNIEPIIRAIPRVTERQEILIVEGHSDDGTRAEIERVMASCPDRNIRLISQPGFGQGDAIREGFSRACGKFIILLEADMTSPPDDIIPVYKSLRAGFGEFIGGTRFVYPMETGSMPLLNRFGNRVFARYFRWLFGQPVSDVLCGIKGISKVHFDRIAARWGQWGVEDPFGDFELLFGAVQSGLKIGEIPVHYRPRASGESKTRAFRHGAILARLAVRAFVVFRR